MKYVFLNLILLISIASVQAGKLTLFVIESPSGLDWSSGTSLARSIVWNYLSFEPHFMGHVNVQLRCQDLKGKNIDVTTGMIAKKLNGVELLLKKDMGMGIMFHSFDGHLETTKESLENIVNFLKENDRISFMSFEISPSQCTRLSHYYQSYKNENIGKYYGLYNRPLFKEGGGCSAFAISFLKLAGIFNKKMDKAWGHTLNVPITYIGKPLTQKRISFLKMLFFEHPWANKQDKDYKKIHFWEPDAMATWIKNEMKDDKTQKITKYGVQGVYFPNTSKKVSTHFSWQKDNRVLPLSSR